MWVVVEGPDGVGKTTLVQHLAQNYRGVAVPSPGGSPLGQLLREIFLDSTMEWPGEGRREVEAAVMAAAMRATFEHSIRPLLGERWVFCDRWQHSLVAYQGGDTHGFMAYEVWKTVMQGVPRPDLVIYLAASHSVLDERQGERASAEGKDRIEQDRSRIVMTREMYSEWARSPRERLNEVTVETDGMTVEDVVKAAIGQIVAHQTHPEEQS